MSLITPRDELADLLIKKWPLDRVSRNRILDSPLPDSKRLIITKRLLSLGSQDRLSIVLMVIAIAFVMSSLILLMNSDGGLSFLPAGKVATTLAITLFGINLAFVAGSFTVRRTHRRNYIETLNEL